MPKTIVDHIQEAQRVIVLVNDALARNKKGEASDLLMVAQSILTRAVDQAKQQT